MEKDRKYQDDALRTLAKQQAQEAEQMKLSDSFTDQLMSRIQHEESVPRLSASHRSHRWLYSGIAASIALVGVMGYLWFSQPDSQQQPQVAQQHTSISTPDSTKTNSSAEEKEEVKDTANLLQQYERMKMPPMYDMAKNENKKKEESEVVEFGHSDLVAEVTPLVMEKQEEISIVVEEPVLAYQDYRPATPDSISQMIQSASDVMTERVKRIDQHSNDMIVSFRGY